MIERDWKDISSGRRYVRKQLPYAICNRSTAQFAALACKAWNRESENRLKSDHLSFSLDQWFDSWPNSSGLAGHVSPGNSRKSIVFSTGGSFRGWTNVFLAKVWLMRSTSESNWVPLAAITNFGSPKSIRTTLAGRISKLVPGSRMRSARSLSSCGSVESSHVQYLSSLPQATRHLKRRQHWRTSIFRGAPESSSDRSSSKLIVFSKYLPPIGKSRCAGFEPSCVHRLVIENYILQDVRFGIGKPKRRV
jgi:hypothetical protein